ncbi:hypothetical protein HN873_056196 [Arachis hypogaea]
MKKGKKVAGDGEAHKYVAKYREESERCVAEVAESVKEALKSLNGKRKGSEAALEKADSKKLKICHVSGWSNEHLSIAKCVANVLAMRELGWRS